MGVLALCEAENWPTLPEDPERATKMLTSPGAATLVAVDGVVVIGFAFAVLDAGGVDAYLFTMVVEQSHRRTGVGRLLIRELFTHTGASRIDLLAEPGSETFYGSFPHRRFQGFRLYPESNPLPRDHQSRWSIGEKSGLESGVGVEDIAEHHT
jgi:GNAT superfamily N-acetyltransferase